MALASRAVNPPAVLGPPAPHTALRARLDAFGASVRGAANRARVKFPSLGIELAGLAAEWEALARDIRLAVAEADAAAPVARVLPDPCPRCDGPVVVRRTGPGRNPKYCEACR